MRRIIHLTAWLLLPLLLTGCTASAEQHTGEAQGYGGTLRVSVTMNGSDITRVAVTAHQETEGVGTRAIDALPARIEQADSADVDGISGATVTSNAIKAAVSQAIGVQNPDLPAQIPAPGGTEDAALEGVGMAATGRIMTGGDANVPGFNAVFAAGRFDDEGRILSIAVDQLEVFSPEIGEGASVFSGFPDGDMTQQDFLAEVSSWRTKGAMGDEYPLPGGSWRSQMNAYEAMMTGMTIDEVKDWYARNFDQETGKPLADAPDAVTGATISLRGEYGDILLAVERAWEDARRQQASPTDMPGGAMTEPTNDTMNDTNTTTSPAEGESSLG